MKVSSRRTGLFLGIIVLALLVYGGYQYIRVTPATPLEAIPENAGMVLLSAKPMRLWQKLKSENDVWNSLIKSPEFEHLNRAIRSIDSALSKYINPEDFFSDRNIVISLHHLPNGKKEFLFVSETTPVVEDLIISRLLGNKTGKGFEIPDELRKIRKIRIAQPEPGGSLLYYTFRRGLFIASYSPDILAQAIVKLYRVSASKSSIDLKAATALAGKTNDGTLLVNFNQLPDLIMGFSAPGFTPSFTRLQHFARYAVFDIYIQKQKIQLNGYTLAEAFDFLRLFKDQQAQQPHALNLLPEATSSFIYLSFSDFYKFVSSYNNYLAVNKDANNPAILSVSDIENLKEIDATEIAVALVNAGYDLPLDNTLVVIRSKNPQRFSAMLNETLANGDSKQMYSINQRIYRNIDFRRIFGSFLVNIFPEFGKACYIALDDFFLFASTPEVLQNYVTSYLAGNKLPRKHAMKTLLQMTDSRSNIWIYYNPAEAVVFHHYLFSDLTAGTLDANLASLSDFDGLSLQFSGNGSHTYTLGIIKHRKAIEYNNSENTVGDTASSQAPAAAEIYWEVNLNEQSASRPIILKNFPGQKNSVGLFGASGTFYLFDANGHQLWAYNFPENPFYQAEVVSIAGKKFLLVTSRKKIYCLDDKGKLLSGYPASFPEESLTTPSLVFDTPDNNPMLVYTSADSIFRAVDLKGRPIKGWKNPKMPSTQHLSVKSFAGQNGKNLIVPLLDGQVLIYTPDGRRLIELSKAFTNSTYSDFYINETNRKGLLLTTDPQGNLIYLNTSGPIEKTVFDNFSESHYFIYSDFNLDRNPDFIYVDNRKLVIYDRFKKVLLQYSFASAIAEKPTLLEIPPQNNLLVIKAENHILYGFNKNGLVFQIAIPNDEISATVGLLNINGHSLSPVRISIVDNKLKVYKLKY